MNYDFSDISPALSVLKELNSIDIDANLNPALKAASQCFNAYEKIFQNSDAMQTALKLYLILCSHLLTKISLPHLESRYFLR